MNFNYFTFLNRLLASPIPFAESTLLRADRVEKSQMRFYLIAGGSVNELLACKVAVDPNKRAECIALACLVSETTTRYLPKVSLEAIFSENLYHYAKLTRVTDITHIHIAVERGHWEVLVVVFHNRHMENFFMENLGSSINFIPQLLGCDISADLLEKWFINSKISTQALLKAFFSYRFFNENLTTYIADKIVAYMKTVPAEEKYAEYEWIMLGAIYHPKILQILLEKNFPIIENALLKAGGLIGLNDSFNLLIDYGANFPQAIKYWGKENQLEILKNISGLIKPSNPFVIHRIDPDRNAIEISIISLGIQETLDYVIEIFETSHRWKKMPFAHIFQEVLFNCFSVKRITDYSLLVKSIKLVVDFSEIDAQDIIDIIGKAIERREYDTVELLAQHFPECLKARVLACDDMKAIRLLLKYGAKHEWFPLTVQNAFERIEQTFLFDPYWIPNSAEWKKLHTLYHVRKFNSFLADRFNLKGVRFRSVDPDPDPKTNMDELIVWAKQLGFKRITDLEAVTQKIRERTPYLGTPKKEDSDALEAWYASIEKDICITIENLREHPLHDRLTCLNQLADTHGPCGGALRGNVEQLRRLTSKRMIGLEEEIFLFYDRFQRGVIEELAKLASKGRPGYHVHIVLFMESIIGLTDEQDPFTDTLINEFEIIPGEFLQQFNKKCNAGTFAVAVYNEFYGKGGNFNPDALTKWLEDQVPAEHCAMDYSKEELEAWKLCKEYHLAIRRREQVAGLEGMKILTQATLLTQEMRRTLFQDKSKLNTLIPIPKKPSEEQFAKAEQFEQLIQVLQEQGVDYNPYQHSSPNQALLESKKRQILEQYLDPETGKVTMHGILKLLSSLNIIV